MGIVFGRTGVEEPAFRVLARRPGYEIRRLPPCVAASVHTQVCACAPTL